MRRLTWKNVALLPFMLSVGFLMLWAKKWCTTYEMINLIIFVLLFLIFIGLRLTASIIVK
jgi:hypothetical protein